MERTFSVEFESTKSDRAHNRANKQIHRQHVSEKAVSFHAEHGSSAAHRALQHRRPNQRIKNKDSLTTPQGFSALGRTARLKAAKEWDQKKLERQEDRRHRKERLAGVEQDVMDRYRQPQHILLDPRLVGAMPTQAVRPRRRQVPVVRKAPFVRRRQPLIDACTRRQQAVETGMWPCVLEENIRAAASALRQLKQAHRPATVLVLQRWLRRRGLCTLRCDTLMTPVALAQALLPLLKDDIDLHRAVEVFANGPPGVLPKDAGPSVADAEEAALRARIRVRVIGSQVFRAWPWTQWARWLCSQSFVLLTSDAAEIFEGLIQRGALSVCSIGGVEKVVYNQSNLDNVGIAQGQTEWCVLDVEKVVERKASCELCRVSLGWGIMAAVRVASLQQSGLASLTLRWHNTALEALTPCRKPSISTLSAKLTRGRLTKQLILHISAVSNDADRSSSDFAKAVVDAVKADIAEQHSAPEFKIDGLVFRGNLRGLTNLQLWLGCFLELERDEDNSLTGSVWVTLRPVAHGGWATEQLVRDVLAYVFSMEPAFRCPRFFSPTDMTALSDNLLRSSVCHWMEHLAGAVIEAWPPEKPAVTAEDDEQSPKQQASDNDCCWFDLCAWPCAASICSSSHVMRDSIELLRNELCPKTQAVVEAVWRKNCKPQVDEWLASAGSGIAEDEEKMHLAEEAFQRGKTLHVAGSGGHPGGRCI